MNPYKPKKEHRFSFGLWCTANHQSAGTTRSPCRQDVRAATEVSGCRFYGVSKGALRWRSRLRHCFASFVDSRPTAMIKGSISPRQGSYGRVLKNGGEKRCHSVQLKSQLRLSRGIAAGLSLANLAF